MLEVVDDPVDDFYRLFSSLDTSETTCKTCRTPFRAGFLIHPDIFLSIQCPTCRLQLNIRYRDAVAADGTLRHVMPHFIGMLQRAAITNARRNAAVGIGLEAAIQQGQGAAWYDADHCSIILHRMGSRRIQQYTLIGHFPGEERGTGVDSLPEALLFLPFEWGVPTDTGWIPGLATGLGITNLAPYRIPEDT